MLKIGFYLREINFRGIPNTVRIFARNNEKILKNKSIIFYNPNSLDNKKEVVNIFKKEFKTVQVKNLEELEKINKKIKLDFIYFQRDGAKDKIIKSSKNIIHAVFPQNIFQYHGHNYAFVSSWLSKNCSNNKYPFVSLPVNLTDNKNNLRKKYKIPRSAKVFGYHGGESSFDLVFVKDAVKKILKEDSTIYFLFLNIKKFHNHRRAIFIKGTFNINKKTQFINTCDAMLHARSLGESFGISCAEFAIKNKPILSYGFCRQRAHFEICNNNIIKYYSYNDIILKIINFNKNKKYITRNLEKKFSEKETIYKFKKIFLKRNVEKPLINIIDYLIVFLFFLQRAYFYTRHKLYTGCYNKLTKTPKI